MGLEDKLTKLDEAIWKQYEKVTHYANREYGLNKYDLATRAALGIGISYLGASVYTLIDGFQTSNSILTALGVLGSLIAMPFYYIHKKRNEQDEAVEIKLLESVGALPSPIFKPYRPFWNSFAAVYFSYAGSCMFGKFTQFNEEQNRLYTAIFLALGSTWICWNSESYFKDQLMTPPKKKKSILKTLYEKVTGKIQPAPQPQLEPTKYQSIDNIVEDA